MKEKELMPTIYTTQIDEAKNEISMFSIDICQNEENEISAVAKCVTNSSATGELISKSHHVWDMDCLEFVMNVITELVRNPIDKSLFFKSRPYATIFRCGEPSGGEYASLYFRLVQNESGKELLELGTFVAIEKCRPEYIPIFCADWVNWIDHIGGRFVTFEREYLKKSFTAQWKNMIIERGNKELHTEDTYRKFLEIRDVKRNIYTRLELYLNNLGRIAKVGLLQKKQGETPVTVKPMDVKYFEPVYKTALSMAVYKDWSDFGSDDVESSYAMRVMRIEPTSKDDLHFTSSIGITNDNHAIINFEDFDIEVVMDLNELSDILHDIQHINTYGVHELAKFTKLANPVKYDKVKSIALKDIQLGDNSESFIVLTRNDTYTVQLDFDETLSFVKIVEVAQADISTKTISMESLKEIKYAISKMLNLASNAPIPCNYSDTLKQVVSGIAISLISNKLIFRTDNFVYGYSIDIEDIDTVIAQIARKINALKLVRSHMHKVNLVHNDEYNVDIILSENSPFVQFRFDMQSHEPIEIDSTYGKLMKINRYIAELAEAYCRWCTEEYKPLSTNLTNPDEAFDNRFETYIMSGQIEGIYVEFKADMVSFDISKYLAEYQDEVMSPTFTMTIRECADVCGELNRVLLSMPAR